MLAIIGVVVLIAFIVVVIGLITLGIGAITAIWPILLLVIALAVIDYLVLKLLCKAFSKKK